MEKVLVVVSPLWSKAMGPMIPVVRWVVVSAVVTELRVPFDCAIALRSASVAAAV
jgi:hypothetical protein